LIFNFREMKLIQGFTTRWVVGWSLSSPQFYQEGKRINQSGDDESKSQSSSNPYYQEEVVEDENVVLNIQSPIFSFKINSQDLSSTQSQSWRVRNQPYLDWISSKRLLVGDETIKEVCLMEEVEERGLTFILFQFWEEYKKTSLDINKRMDQIIHLENTIRGDIKSVWTISMIHPTILQYSFGVSSCCVDNSIIGENNTKMEESTNNSKNNGYLDVWIGYGVGEYQTYQKTSDGVKSEIERKNRKWRRTFKKENQEN